MLAVATPCWFCKYECKTGEMLQHGKESGGLDKCTKYERLACKDCLPEDKSTCQNFKEDGMCGGWSGKR